MPPLVISNLGLGLNLHDPATEIANGQMAFARNMLFSRGVMKTPHGVKEYGGASLPLDSSVIGIAPYQEKGHNPTDHLVAMTLTKLYGWDGVAAAWEDISPTTPLAASLDNVPSFAAFPHIDSVLADGSGVACYYHLLACDGGSSPVLRWAGQYENTFYPLAGADGYHETDADPVTPTAHYCKQVAVFYNHVILMSPKTWNAEANAFIDNPQAVFWGKAGRLETDPDNTDGKGAFDLTETGAGYVSIVDSGGENVRCLQLGDTLVVYQNNSIWYLYHVGGSTVFLARCEVPDMGLLAPGLVQSWRNAHYLIASDYSPYIYHGGGNKTQIGVNIAEALKDDMDPGYLNRCRMAVGANGRRIWIFIVRNGQRFITRAYGVDTLSGAWMIRDFEHLYGAVDEGMCSVALVGGQSYMSGQSYQDDITDGETYAEAIAATDTYADMVDAVTIGGETMMVGDQAGMVFNYDESVTTDNGTAIPAEAHTKVFDLGRPDTEKQWATVSLKAKGTSLQLSYRIESFETQDDDWIDFTLVSLTDDYVTYEFGLEEVCSEEIQFKIANSGGGTLYVEKLVLEEPMFL